MEQNILLTYEHIDGYNTYAWFTSIKDVNDFIITSKEITSLIECMDCTNCKEIDLAQLVS